MRQMIKHYCQRPQIIRNNFVICLLGLLCLNYAYAIPAKVSQDEKLRIILNENQQLCVYSSDEKYYIGSLFIREQTLFRTNSGYTTMPQIPKRNPFAGSGLKNCITSKEFVENAEYNQPYYLGLVFLHRDTLSFYRRNYTEFCIENKNQQIRLVGVEKQGNQFVCTDKDWQPYQYQRKKGFWARLFGR